MIYPEPPEEARACRFTSPVAADEGKIRFWSFGGG